MRAILCKEWCEFEALTIEDVPLPELKPASVRIAIKAAGLGFGQSLLVAGKYQRKPQLPFVPGVEIAGEVMECAPEITRCKPGDRVAALLDVGGYSEQAVAWEENTFPIPEGLDFDRAVFFVTSYITAFGALEWRARLKPGETLLVFGAAGAVGMGAVEIGKAMGANVVATASTPEKRTAAKAHGADHVLDPSSGNLRGQVKDLTGGAGADVIFDPVGGALFDEAIRCVNLEGRILTIGFASGRIPHAPLNLLLVKNVSVMGYSSALYFGWSGEEERKRYAPRILEGMERLFNWFETGRLNPTIDRFDLADFVAAMGVIRERKAIGKIVLAP